jgi:hypothetical protein
VLLPAVRKAANDTLIVSDGFSCREQILQGTGRAALHFAQVLQMAIHEGPAAPRDLAKAEREYAVEPRTPAVPWTVAGAAALSVGAWMWRRSRR